ncbi:uncharacterized protein LOC114746383 [Neltuma alba]|uniref:uncharacterized protein LOC114746383 n=1 Tax=Neltuma alba TaxID=207710 RepID=UPI0010A3692D|nr:uncharacterized protein LOC114746383 [Prosopis alba]
MLKENWTRQKAIQDELNDLESELKHWNQMTFGHITRKKKKILKRIAGIQRSNQQKNNPYLDRLETELQEELNEILGQEEIFWFQKARTNWLRDGDRNTAFYHTKTKIRRRRNRVTMLKDEDNNWVEGKQELGNLVNRFFQHLFTEEEEERIWHVTTHNWTKIRQEEWRDMVREVTNEEIRKSMYSIGALKAPGEDGYPAAFFHK